MTTFLAFDVYGTLVDTAGIANAMRPIVGERTAEFAAYWRDKQLEYSFRRALMQNYVDFSVCTAQALDYTCSVFNVNMSADERKNLLSVYKTLPAFPDVDPGLRALQNLDAKMFAFSNGHPDDLESLLKNTGIRCHFEGVVSLFNVRTFKPNPAAYAWFHRAAKTGGAETWLVSSNPFDVIGAVSAGMKAIWVKRSAEAIFDPWEIHPTATVSNLAQIAALFNRN